MSISNCSATTLGEHDWTLSAADGWLRCTQCGLLKFNTTTGTAGMSVNSIFQCPKRHPAQGCDWLNALDISQCAYCGANKTEHSLYDASATPSNNKTEMSENNKKCAYHEWVLYTPFRGEGFDICSVCNITREEHTHQVENSWRSQLPVGSGYNASKKEADKDRPFTDESAADIVKKYYKGR